MNSNHQDIVSFIESIYASRHFIAQAYCDGSVDIADENQRPLRQLQQIRVMGPGVKSDTLRLSSPMRKLFDEVLQRFRSLSISSNFLDQLNRLSELSEGFVQACIEGRTEDQEMYASDFDLAAYDISEEVESTLLHVNTMAHNNFASAPSYAEKVRQNDHYLKQMRKLVTTLNSLQDQGLVELLDSSLDTQVLSQLYQHHIIGRLSNWRAMLLDIISHMERYLNKLRTVEPNAKRIRMFSMFFHQHPEYTPRDIDEYPSIPEWAYRHEGDKLACHPDIREEAMFDDFALLAKSIGGAVVQKVKRRLPGVFIPDTEELVAELNPTQFEQMVYEYVQQARVSKEPLSAVTFFTNSDHLAGNDVALSLMCFASLIEVKTRALEMGINDIKIVKVVEANDNPFHGNVTVLDFLSCQRC